MFHFYDSARVASEFNVYTYTMTCGNADVDECEEDNGGCNALATCANTLGNRTCTCLPEYTGDGFTCTGKWD